MKCTKTRPPPGVGLVQRVELDPEKLVCTGSHVNLAGFPYTRFLSVKASAGALFSMIMDISAVPVTAENRDQKTFTGGIAKNF